MSDPTNDNDRNIDALLQSLGDGWRYWPEKHAALTALVAERDSLRAEIAAAYRDRASARSVFDRVKAERDALKQRVAELEARSKPMYFAHGQRPESIDLREQLVCAIWPVIMRQWREYKDAIDPRGCARSDALEEADKMIAAMRKEGGGA